MKVNQDVYRRQPCQSKTIRFLQSAIVLMITAVIVFALCVIVSGPIGSAMDRQDAAESEMVQKLRQDMRGW